MMQETINIAFTGDFCPINRIEELALNKEYSRVFNDYEDVFNGNDLNIVDLECPLTLSIKTRPKTGPYQKAHPATIELLSHAGINLVALANNHIMDYGSQGAKDTIELCSKHGIGTIGIGQNLEAAGKPYILHAKNKRVAIFNYADNEFLTTPDGQLTCNPLDTVNAFYQIGKSAEENSYTVVIAHAGNEFYHLPSPRTKRLYRSFIEMGADAVISHHTHVFSGYELYKEKPIFYGLGNFVYDWPGKIDSDWNTGYTVRLKLSERLDFDIVPLKQGNHQPGVFRLDENEAASFFEQLAILNEIIDNDAELEFRFQQYCNSVFPMYYAFIEPNFGKYITALQKRGLFPKLLSRKKRLFLLNLSRCKSHRDVLLRMLKKYE